MAEKVGTILRDDFRTADGGLYYQDEDSGKYGIMSYEGKHDTGAKYASCDPKGMFFEVSNTILENYYDIKKLNSVGLVNGKGELIIPMAYASIVLSDEYDGFIAKTFIEGHTAPVEGSSYTGDMQLSVDRATNVKNYCLSPEVGTDISKIADKIEAVGYSNSKPVYDANGNADMAASRRVSFRFMLNIDI